MHGSPNGLNAISGSVGDIAALLMTVGALLVLGLATDALGRRSPLPRVTLLLILGFAIGPAGLALLPPQTSAWSPAISHMALLMVGFLLGGRLTRATLREHGRLVLLVSLSVAAVTGALVCTGLWVFGAPVAVSLVLGTLATSTAPAATSDVVREMDEESPFSRTLLGIVAVDDVWGLLLFSLVLGGLEVASGSGSGSAGILFGLRDLGGAIAVGVALGVPMSYLTGRIQPGEPTLTEGLGMVFLCGGLALWLDVSFLVSAMTMGAVVANLARHHTRPFHEIENVEWPFLVLFFVLAGASLDVQQVGGVGAIGGLFLVLRFAGRLLGGMLGASLSGEPLRAGLWLGAGLLPQAGVALGMALVAAQRIEGIAETVLTVTIGATVVFEIVGPVLTRAAIRRMGSSGDGPPLPSSPPASATGS